MSDDSETHARKKTPSPLSLILKLALRHWYCFVISLPLFLTAGYFYTKTQSYRYSANALILLNTGEKDSGMHGSKQAIFEDMQIMDDSTSIENEIVQLKSSQILGKVVDELGLTVQYYIKPLWRLTNIYGAHPVSVKIIEQTEKQIPQLLVRPIDTKSYRYAPITAGQNSKDIPDSACKTAQYDEVISFGDNRISVHTTQYWGNGYQHEDIMVKFPSRAACIAKLKTNITIARADKVTNTVKLDYVSSNKKIAEDILSTLISVYEQEIIVQKNQAAKAAEQFINERISDIYKTLGEVDTALADYKIEHDIVSMENASTSAFARETKYEDLISDIDMQMTMITTVSKSLEETGSYKPIPPNKAFIELGIDQQINSFNQLVIKYKELSKNAGSNNPVVVSLMQEIATSRNNTQVAIKNLVTNLELQKKQYQNKQKLAEKKIAALPEKEKAVKDVTREQSIKEQLYLYLLNKREENSIKLAMTESNILVIEPPKSASAPISPQVPKIMFMAGIAGLAFPALGIFLITSINNKIESVEDIENLCSIPIIGQLTKQKKGSMIDYRVKEDSRDLMAENFRIVASNLEYFNKKLNSSESAGGQIIQITSARPQEGKTTISVNLALALSFANKKVVLLDADMRMRSLSKHITRATKSQLGLLSYLRGTTDKLEDILIPSPNSKSLWAIQMRSTPPNATALINSTRFTELLDKLKEQFDYIILDTPPFYAVADGQILNQHADITLWVAAAGRIHKSALSELEGLYQKKTLKNPAILLNMVNARNQGYGYGYGYGYEYGSNEKKTKSSTETQ